ncbi:MAG: transposase [Candidatus Nitrotoga sp.]
MTRPLRLEYSGALYHVTSRGDRREDIYLDDVDREEWLQVLGHVCSRYNWVVHTYCLMTNHYHFLVETVDGNLSKGMRQLNGLYTQRFNSRHGLSGHLYQGRYKAILIQKENYLLELSRYVVLNPLRADMVKKLEDWPWSSYLATINVVGKPEWLDVDWLLGQFGKQRKSAIKAYVKFVMEGKGLPSPLDQTRHQLLLGDDNFVGQYKQNKKPEALREISKVHRRVLALSLDEYKQNHPSRNEAMARAYLSGAYSMAEIGKYFGVHYMTVSRAVRQFEGE